MAIHRDYKDILIELNAAGAEFLVVGAFAFSFHAEPRYTKDLDLWVNPTPSNAQRVYSALARFGAPLQGVQVSDLSTPGVVYQMGVEPVRVDILTAISGVQFSEAWQRREQGSYGSVPISILSVRDLITSKEAAGRPQDLEDVRTLRMKFRE